MMNRRTLRAISSLAFGLLLLVGVLWFQHTLSNKAYAAPTATDYFASKSGSGNFCTESNPCQLEQALNFAVHGDTIYVAQGTYTSTGPSVITLTQSITFYGGWSGYEKDEIERNPDSFPTIIDGENSRRAIFMNTGITPTIDGFIITRGNASYSTYDQGLGGGIYGRYAAPVISNNVISENIAYTSTSTTAYGGGVYLWGSDVSSVISGNTFISNVASTSNEGYGGGLFIGVPDTMGTQILYNFFLSNTASITNGLGYGGALYIASADGTTVMGNTIEYNVAQAGTATASGAGGGGLYFSGSDEVLIEDNVLQHNVASVTSSGLGGGISAAYCDYVEVISNTIQHNHGSQPGGSGEGRGGGLQFHECLDLIVDRNKVISNTAMHGAGLYVRPGTSFTLTNNVFAENEAGFYGGGMAFLSTTDNPITGTLVHNTFAANNLGSGGGQDAIYIQASGVTLVLTNNVICTHTTGIYVASGSTVNLDHTLFYGNSYADTGGDGTIVNSNPITGQNPLLDSTYHLMDGSPAILTGLTLGWPALDVDGETRRIGLPDIGADQYQFPQQVYLPLVLKSY